MDTGVLLNLFNSLNKEEEKAFWNVVEDLPDSIYLKTGKESLSVNLNYGGSSDKLFAELLTLIENHNVLIRIFKEVKYNDNLEECVKDLKGFYNNPANEEAWRRIS